MGGPERPYGDVFACEPKVYNQWRQVWFWHPPYWGLGGLSLRRFRAPSYVVIVRADGYTQFDMDKPKPISQEIIAYAQSIADAIRDPLIILNSDLRILFANRAFHAAFQTTASQTNNHPLSVLGAGPWNAPELVALLTGAVADRNAFDDFDLSVDTPNGRRTLLLSGRALAPVSDSPTLLVLSLQDAISVAARGPAASANLSQEQIHDKQIALAVLRPMLFQPKEDAFSGLAVQTAYAMASDEALVGGDFWDTFAYDHGHVALVLGDVMGHGAASAIFTTELKHTMRAYIREHEQPGRILFQMNQFLYQSNRLFDEGINSEGDNAPVCIAIAVIERETGNGALALAGMEPPLLVRENGAYEQPDITGISLGIEPKAKYTQIDFQLAAGDTFILSTDGVTEARQGQAFLENEGLIRLALAGNRGSLKEMADGILNGARDFAGGVLRDDASIILVRRTEFSPSIEKKRSDP